MTTDDLLITRYKPNCDFPFINKQVKYYGENFVIKGTLFHTKDYPLIFSEIKWWEDRQVEDLPNYVRDKRDGSILKVDTWDTTYHEVTCSGYDKEFKKVVKKEWYSLHELEPSTEEEYNEIRYLLFPIQNIKNKTNTKLKR